jgi:hypothetical protein
VAPVTTKPAVFNDVIVKDIGIWKNQVGDSCTCFIEEAMKEHEFYHSTKPVASDVPGEPPVGDFTFVKMKMR